MTKFLVLEWIGFWGIPDHAHGGIDPGPYNSQDEAQCAINNYIFREMCDWCSQVDDTEFLIKHNKILENRLRATPVEWPEDSAE